MYICIIIYHIILYDIIKPFRVGGNGWDSVVKQVMFGSGVDSFAPFGKVSCIFDDFRLWIQEIW